MSKIPTYILGTGSIGSGLARALSESGHTVTGVWNRRQTPNSELLRRDFEVCTGDNLERAAHAIENSKVIFIAVSDDAIEQVSHLLHASTLLAPNTIIAHLSGCLSSDVLHKAPHIHNGSFHPLAACPNPSAAQDNFRKTFITIEGDQRARAVLTQIAKTLGSQSGYIDAHQKARYHAAAVMASNLMIALLASAEDEAKACGLEGIGVALNELALGALQRTLEMGISAGLTGPVVRADTSSIKKHLNCLSADGKAIYRNLSLRATQIGKERGLNAASIDELVEILNCP